jgi:hypothetical protein
VRDEIQYFGFAKVTRMQQLRLKQSC